MNAYAKNVETSGLFRLAVRLMQAASKSDV